MTFGNIDTENAVIPETIGGELKISSGRSSYYVEEDSIDTENLLNKGNKIAEDIEEFIQSVRDNDGYYIARYEAGVIDYDNLQTSNSENSTDWTGYSGENMKLVIRRDVQPWNYITQNRAANLSREIDNSYTESNVTSDLINSYAWDTAILFIQKYSGDEGYSRQNALQNTLANTGKATDGTKNDNPCNIYDMAGNCYEWTTETSSIFHNVCVSRGGYFNDSSSYYYTSARSTGSTTVDSRYGSFRPFLYL